MTFMADLGPLSLDPRHDQASAVGHDVGGLLNQSRRKMQPRMRLQVFRYSLHALADAVADDQEEDRTPCLTPSTPQRSIGQSQPHVIKTQDIFSKSVRPTRCYPNQCR